MDGHYLVDILDHLFAEQGRVGSHADDILIVVVVRDAVHIVGHGQRLAFGRSRRCGELARLHSVVEPQRPEIQERRQNIVDSVVEQVVQLPFGRHGHADHGDLHLVLLERYVVAMEITPVEDILPHGINDRVVTRRIELIFEHAARIEQRFINRAQDLRRTAQ